MWQILRRYCQLVLVFFACHIAFKWRFCGICELCHNWKTRKYAHYIILTLSFFSPNKENSRFLIFCLLCWAAASAAVSISSPSPGSGRHSAVREYQYTSAIFMRLCNSGVLCSHYTPRITDSTGIRWKNSLPLKWQFYHVWCVIRCQYRHIKWSS